MWRSLTPITKGIPTHRNNRNLSWEPKTILGTMSVINCRISAHGFAKIDEQAEDLPVSTLEVWLQERLSEGDRKTILSKPIAEIMEQGRPEQVVVLRSLSRSLGYDRQKSDRANRSASKKNSSLNSPLKRTYSERVTMELLNIMAEKKVRQSGNADWIAVLEKLLNCEGRSL